ncbi:MAG: CYTH domain-containing protein [Elusimicrobiota bacterium]|jgi:triphosphatase|nr:CYTH domain-containing protein [Elusimicrobiota bacterium]
MIIEREYKWAAAGPCDFAAFQKAPALADFARARRKIIVVDSYFDSTGSALQKTKTALRLRSVNGRYEITLKGDSRIKNGLASRPERTLKLSAKSRARAMAALRAFFAKNWPALEGLRRLFIIKNKRTVWDIKSPALEAEICFDDCIIIKQQKSLKFYEIELEYKKGSASAFTRLAAQLTKQGGLEYSKKSKVATAAELL